LLPSNCTIASDATSYDLTDFYFGLPSSINLGNNFVSNLRQHAHALYVQDDWRVTPKLTVNLGLRWEFATPLWDRDNNWSNFDPATGTVLARRAARGHGQQRRDVGIGNRGSRDHHDARVRSARQSQEVFEIGGAAGDDEVAFRGSVRGRSSVCGG
jgi:hypothetical protein